LPPVVYHIVRLAIPRSLVSRGTEALTEAYSIIVTEDLVPIRNSHTRLDLDPDDSPSRVFASLPDSFFIAAYYQLRAFPSRHIAKLSAEAILRRLDAQASGQGQTFPPGTVMNGMLMPPNQVIRMGLLLLAANNYI
jgi:hypothetical protein